MVLIKAPLLLHFQCVHAIRQKLLLLCVFFCAILCLFSWEITISRVQWQGRSKLSSQWTVCIIILNLDLYSVSSVLCVSSYTYNTCLAVAGNFNMDYQIQTLPPERQSSFIACSGEHSVYCVALFLLVFFFQCGLENSSTLGCVYNKVHIHKSRESIHKHCENFESKICS